MTTETMRVGADGSPLKDGGIALGERLLRARKELLDLSARNRMLHVPRENPRSSRLDIVNERADDIYRMLVAETRSMSFLGSDAAPVVSDDPDAAYVDDKLQTALPEQLLEKRLLKTYYDAHTFEEEQGANILFLAIGFLRWFEAEQGDTPRHAPLLLIPVELERRKAGAKFTLRYDETDLSPNASLAEKLRELGLELPELPEADELVPSRYFGAVRAAIAERPNWQVDDNGVVLWFFSFAKFLMYRDLDPTNWSGTPLTDKASIQALLQDGFRSDPSLIAEAENLDQAFHPRDLVHILEADSSQTVVIEEVKAGRSLVVQGPPGTGKSQTIANMIASAVKANKRVLFVAEKVAALQVVKQRLDAAGLGTTCLELHSHKSNKVAVLEELRRTLELGRPIASNVGENAEALKEERDRLNGYVAALHAPVLSARVTAYEAMGELVRLQAQGFRPLDVSLTHAAEWQRADLSQRKRVLEELGLLVEYVGVPADHPCRGVHATTLLPTDRNRILDQLRGLLTELDQLRAASVPLCQTLEAPPVATLDQIGQLSAGLYVLGQAPHGDMRCLAASEWEVAVGELRVLIQNGSQFASEAAPLSQTVTDAAWSVDVALARTHLAAHGRSFFRFLSGDYRRARALVRGICRSVPPESVDGCIALLDALANAQRLRATLAGAHGLGARAFGGQWQGEASRWAELAQLVQWVELANHQDPTGRVRRAAARIGSARDAVVQAEAFRQRVANLRTAFDSSLARLQFDTLQAFGVHDVGQVPLDELRARLSQWIEAPLILDRWTSYNGAASQLGALQLGAFVPLIEAGKLAPSAFVPQLSACFYEEALRKAFECFPVLNAFDGNAHARAIERFQALDRERLRMARYEVCLAHAQSLPSQQGDAGEMGVLRKQISKKRGLLPLRQLIHQAGSVIQAIKPVFMMSPISVAQFLKPGSVEFDLLLIDEASQVAPVDALGAIARCQQIVVVGDEKQLPPTSFFQRMGTSEEDAEEDTLADTPSILKLCEGQGLPQRMLRWHYRSRHHSLIAVSNREFYDGRLFIPPSPEAASSAMGLRFRHVAEGVFDRGNTARNAGEARVVVEHILEHARETPEKSLGVGAFSMAQRDAILEALEPARKAHPDLETFFARSGQDGFFVKNLESIQGDERDVIFISVGYGKDSSGLMSMNFGPLNNDGGERRLNVLITRARERCEVFSSITADDIDLKKTSARGVVALRQFLHYAATGSQDAGVPTEKGFGSPFEEQVARAIQRHGYAVDSQVGVAGFFIDLAVPHPEQAGRYLLGIECDGAQYRSSRCARDRDRLRQQVLEDRGWAIVRVWSPDWFRDPDGQTKRLIDALASARVKPLGVRPAARKVEPESELNRLAPASVAASQLGARYVEASFAIPATPIHDLQRDELAEIVWRILEVEAPVHRDEIARRITGLWGLSRTGGRIARAVDDALHLLESRGRTHAEGDFFSIAGRQVVPRDRGSAGSTNLRKAEYLPPSEIHAALRMAVSSNQGIDEERLLTEALRLLGFKSIGPQVRAVALSQLQALCRSNAFERREDRLYLPKLDN